MALFVSEEQKKRYAYIDSSIEATIDTLRVPEVARALGDHVTRLSLASVQTLKPANVRHGVAKLSPKDLSTETIPIVALAAGESVVLDKKLQRLTPFQQLQMSETLRSMQVTANDPLINYLVRTFDNETKPRVFTQRPNALGTVTCSRVIGGLPLDQFNTGKNTMRNFSRRPFVSLLYETPHIGVASNVLLHETTHVLQRITDPVKKDTAEEDIKNSALRDELEAYHIEAVLNESLSAANILPDSNLLQDKFIIEDNVRYDMARFITLMRQETNAKRKDKFFPNGTLKKLLEEYGLDITG